MVSLCQSVVQNITTVVLLLLAIYAIYLIYKYLIKKDVNKCLNKETCTFQEEKVQSTIKNATRNPFLNYFREYRKNNANLPVTEAAANAGKRWTCMSNQERAAYTEMAQKAEYRYISRNKCLNKILTYLKGVEKEDNEVDLDQLTKVSKMLRKWRKEVNEL